MIGDGGPWTPEKAAESHRRFLEDNPGYNREANRRWNIAQPAKRMMLDIRRRAKERGLPCTIDDLWIEVRLPDGCEMTGIPFDMRSGGPWPFGPSVDRESPDLGYTEENCRLVCWMYNLAKGRWTDEDVIRMCQARVKFEGIDQ